MQQQIPYYKAVKKQPKKSSSIAKVESDEINKKYLREHINEDLQNDVGSPQQTKDKVNASQENDELYYQTPPSSKKKAAINRIANGLQHDDIVDLYVNSTVKLSK